MQHLTPEEHNPQHTTAKTYTVSYHDFASPAALDLQQPTD